jgi:hypothetical protein
VTIFLIGVNLVSAGFKVRCHGDSSNSIRSSSSSSSSGVIQVGSLWLRGTAAVPVMAADGSPYGRHVQHGICLFDREADILYWYVCW